MDDTPKLCIDCRYCETTFMTGPLASPRCLHPMASRINVVTGERYFLYCQAMRELPCGYHAKLFEPRLEVA